MRVDPRQYKPSVPPRYKYRSCQTQIPCALKTPPAAVTNDQHIILTPADLQLHPVAARHLKCHMIGMGMVVMTI